MSTDYEQVVVSAYSVFYPIPLPAGEWRVGVMSAGGPGFDLNLRVARAITDEAEADAYATELAQRYGVKIYKRGPNDPQPIEWEQS